MHRSDEAGRELTFRAVFAGMAIGGVLALGNIYLGLRTGFWDAGGITAAIVGFALIAPLARGASSRFSPAEHNVLVAAAMAVASTPSVMGLIGAVPALSLLGAAPSTAVLTLWAVVLGAMGILVALPLRVLLVERDNLPFPTARATGEVIAAAHAHESHARRRALALGGAAIAAGALTWLRDGAPRWIPGLLLAPGALAANLQLGLAVSPMLLGGGVLIGLRTGLELLLGAVVAWIVIAPSLDPATASSWLLWPGVGLVLGGGISGLLLEWRTFGALGRDLRAFSGRAPLLLVLVAAAAVTAVAVLGLGVPPALALVGIVLFVPLAAIFLRIAGTTDIAHYGAIGQVTQGVLGVVTPSTAAANVAGGSITSGAAPQTLQLIYSFKIATTAGGRKGPLIWASLAGLVAGAFLSAQAYAVLDRAYHVGSAALPAPTAAAWRAMAVVAQDGLTALPDGAPLAAGLGLAAGIALTLAARARALRWLPSPLSVGLAFLIPASISAGIALGSVAGRLVSARAPRWSEENLAPAAAGAIAGEAVIAFLAALLIVLGVLGGG